VRSNLPPALFTTGVISNGRQRRYLAIGATGANEPITCYQFSWSVDNSNNYQLVYLYTGVDHYQLWRRYYQALAEAENEQWVISPQADRPRVSEVAKVPLQ
jgi:hypothetical protein